MTTRTVLVKISGPALSLLLYENINSILEQEGFLLGSVNTSVTKSVTDETREDVKIKDVVNITGVLPCDLPNLYYQANGELIEDKLIAMLGKQRKNVIAWFKYQKFRKSGFKFTIRERVLHGEFTRFFNMPPHLFTCCILTSAASENKSTQVFSHAFINVFDTQLRMIPMHIENLGDQCHTYQQNTKPSDAFMSLFNKINKNQSDLQLGVDIHDKLQHELKSSITDLASSEQRLWQLQAEVESISKQIRRVTLASNKWPSEKNKYTKTKEIEIEVPVLEEKQVMSGSIRNNEDIIEILESGPDVDESEPNQDETTAIVDLTLSDEEEFPARKTRSQRTKTVKNKNEK